MDTAVGLVQSYLYMNGYFTVTEYPIIELLAEGDVRSVTDVDVLAVRFPGAGRVDLRDHATRLIEPDPNLGVDRDRVDLIIAEVKEGRAELNDSARSPDVLHTALHRFGRMDPDDERRLVQELIEDGIAEHPVGARVRLMSFGSRPPREAGDGYRWMLLGDVASFIRSVLVDHWSSASAMQSKDPVLSLMLLLEKAARGE